MDVIKVEPAKVHLGNVYSAGGIVRFGMRRAPFIVGYLPKSFLLGRYIGREMGGMQYTSGTWRVEQETAAAFPLPWVPSQTMLAEIYIMLLPVPLFSAEPTIGRLPTTK